MISWRCAYLRQHHPGNPTRRYNLQLVLVTPEALPLYPKNFAPYR
ncbi:MAG: hypothetical protein ACI9IV_000196 [Paracoccaceae bacterium]